MRRATSSAAAAAAAAAAGRRSAVAAPAAVSAAASAASAATLSSFTAAAAAASAAAASAAGPALPLRRWAGSSQVEKAKHADAHARIHRRLLRLREGKVPDPARGTDERVLPSAWQEVDATARGVEQLPPRFHFDGDGDIHLAGNGGDPDAVLAAAHRGTGLLSQDAFGRAHKGFRIAQLSQPERLNTMTGRDLRQIRDVLAKWADNKWSIHSMCVASTGRVFSAGEDWGAVLADVDAWAADRRRRRLAPEDEDADATLSAYYAEVAEEHSSLNARLAALKGGASAAADDAAFAERMDHGQARPLLEVPEGPLRVANGASSEPEFSRPDGPDPLRALAQDKVYAGLGLARLGKPFMPLAEGMTSGAGAALWLHGDARLVTPDARIAFPAAQLGGIPDMLAWRRLARREPPARRPYTRYLALTGDPIAARDALHLGYAYACVDAAMVPTLSQGLDQIGVHPDDSEEVQIRVLDTLMAGEVPIDSLPTENSILAHAECIEACFGNPPAVGGEAEKEEGGENGGVLAATDPGRIIRALEAWNGADAEWARGVAHRLRHQCSARAMAATLHLLSPAAANLPVVAAARREYALNVALAPELLRGVRARVGRGGGDGDAAVAGPSSSSSSSSSSVPQPARSDDAALAEAARWVAGVVSQDDAGSLEIPRRWLRFGQQPGWNFRVAMMQRAKMASFVEGSEIERTALRDYAKFVDSPPSEQDRVWAAYELLGLTDEHTLRALGLVREDGSLDPWILRAQLADQRELISHSVDRVMPTA